MRKVHVLVKQLEFKSNRVSWEIECYDGVDEDVDVYPGGIDNDGDRRDWRRDVFKGKLPRVDEIVRAIQSEALFLGVFFDDDFYQGEIEVEVKMVDERIGVHRVGPDNDYDLAGPVGQQAIYRAGGPRDSDGS